MLDGIPERLRGNLTKIMEQPQETAAPAAEKETATVVTDAKKKLKQAKADVETAKDGVRTAKKQVKAAKKEVKAAKKNLKKDKPAK